MFINDRIITSVPGPKGEQPKTMTLKEAAAIQSPKVRSLDEILAEIDAKNKGVKTASVAPAQVKTASTEVAATAAAPATTAAPATKVEVKVAGIPDFIQEKIDAKKEGKDGEKGEKKEEKKKPDEKEACSAASTKTLKVAKSLDFRPWKAEDIVGAWSQHGTMEKCIANVAGKASDPKTYCGLLQVASTEAGKAIKVASAPAAAAPKAPVFKKIAKMTEKERAFLAKYYGKLYGKEYVDALLENY